MALFMVCTKSSKLSEEVFKYPDLEKSLNLTSFFSPRQVQDVERLSQLLTIESNNKVDLSNKR